MGHPTTDGNNPGRRTVQEYVVSGALDESQEEAGRMPEKRGVDFLVLKNCLVDKRLGAVLKRPGSALETIASSLGVPLGIGEFLENSNTPIPIESTLLANFGGATFYKQEAGTWSIVNQTAFVSFGSTRQTSFARLAGRLYIAGGLPAKWKSTSSSIDRIGIIPPSGTITITSTAAAGAITLVTGTQYMHTFYDSATGLESDWSPLSASTGAVTSKQIDIAIPAASAANWDKIRIYRTLDGGAFPYLVATVNSGTTTYTDNTPDASLTTRAADRFEYSVPPTSSYIGAAFAGCLWFIDADNPNTIRFSKPYVGDANEVEYFPIDNFLTANDPMTGLYVVGGKMLVFHPRGVSYISGFTADDFVFQPFCQGVGTIFNNSISSNGRDIAFIGEEGPIIFPNAQPTPQFIGREIDPSLKPILTATFNEALYVSSAWSASLRQFVFMIGALASANARWEEVGTGNTSDAIAGWIDVVSTDYEYWESLDMIGVTTAIRIKMWAWSPELSTPERNIWMEYTHPYIVDNNDDDAFPVFVFNPSISSNVLSAQQDRLLLGYYDGTEGHIATILRSDKSQDNDTDIISEVLTDKLIPGIRSGGYKLFQSLGFPDAYLDASSDGDATFKYVLDYSDPHLRDYASQLVTISGSVDLKKFPTMLGRHIHLYLTDSSNSLSKVLLSNFFIHYREKFRREGR